MDSDTTLVDIRPIEVSSEKISSLDVSNPIIMNGLTNGVNGSAHREHKHKSKDKDREHRDKHKSEHRDKHKDEHRDKRKDEHRDKHKDEHRDKHKDKHRDRSRHSSKERREHKDKKQDKEKSRDKDKDRNSDKHKDRDKHKEKDRSSEKHKSDKSKEEGKDRRSDNHKDSSDKTKHSASGEKLDKDNKPKDKESNSGSGDKVEKDKDSKSKDKEANSESGEKNDSKRKDRESSHKHKSHKSDKDRSKSDDKHRSHDKDKHKSSSSHKSSGDKSKSFESKSRDEASSKVKLENGETVKSKKDDKKRDKSDKIDKRDDDNLVEKEESVIVKNELTEECNSTHDFKDESFKKNILKEESKISDDTFGLSNSHSNVEEFIEDSKPEIKDEPMLEFEEMDETPELEFEEIEETTMSNSDSEDEVPLMQRASLSSKKRKISESEDSDSDVPLSARAKKKKKEEEKKKKKPKKMESDYEEDYSEEEVKPKAKKKSRTDDYSSPVKKKKVEPKKESQNATPSKKKKEEEVEVWKWWEEEKKDDGVKWKFLEHKGPLFAPPYERLPSNVKFYYDGEEVRLSEDAEEIATFYARMIEHDYTTKDVFNQNFFKDWRKSMTPDERSLITDLKKCNFKKIHAYFIQKSEERKAMSKEEKKKIKEENEKIAEEYGVCKIDGHKEKIGNFRIEPPGLFRGRGEHPKMGKLKRRIMPEDVIINCSKDAVVPKPPAGHKWKEVRHDNTVTWLANWVENVQGQGKYVMLNPASKLKGEKDWQKYETARRLAKSVNKIREDYRQDLKSKEMRIRQRAVAMYFIDKLALRAGNEKDEDQADTVGCCSLRVEHISLHEKMDDKEYVVVFDFLGKDSIRYYNEVPVEKRVFRNLQLFVENKKGKDDLFDRLNTSVLNKYLNELMEGLTAKVFRTYNASITLQNQLRELTDPDASLPEKVLQYNRANRAVAILCNHQRAVPKTHEKSMGNLKEKIATKRAQVKEAEKQLKEAKRDLKNGSQNSKIVLEKKKKCVERLKEQLTKLEVSETDKEENKTIALGTSKLNYLDPRISVAWCKKYDVPIDKVYNKTQRMKFQWAIDMAGPDYVF